MLWRYWKPTRGTNNLKQAVRWRANTKRQVFSMPKVQHDYFPSQKLPVAKSVVGLLPEISGSCRLKNGLGRCLFGELRCGCRQKHQKWDNLWQRHFGRLSWVLLGHRRRDRDMTGVFDPVRPESWQSESLVTVSSKRSDTNQARGIGSPKFYWD